MSLLVNNTLANPQTSFYATSGASPTPPVPGGNSLQSPASIVPAVDGSVSLNLPATGSAAGSLSISSGAGAASASITGNASATVNLLSTGPSQVNVSSTSGAAEMNVSSTSGAGSVSVSGTAGNSAILTAGPTAASLTLTNTTGGNAAITIGPSGTASFAANSTADATIAAVCGVAGGPNTASLLASNTGSGTASVTATSTGGPAAMSIVSGGASPATLGVNANGTGAVVVTLLSAAADATLTVDSTIADASVVVIAQGNAFVQIGGDSGSGVLPSLVNQGDGVIRLTNVVANTNDPSEVLTADVVNRTLNVKGLGGAPQVLLASQNIAIGNATLTVPNPTGEGLYCIMIGSTPTSTQQSRQAQLVTMAYVNSAGAIQIGGNGTSTFPVGGSITIYPNEGANNMSLVIVASPGLANMSVVAFNISGPIPSAF
jgi:hypothetical protein